MALENKLGITNSAELAREEERISKKKAVELFESGALDKLAPGRFASLQARRVNSRLCRQFTNICLKIFMTLPVNCAR